MMPVAPLAGADLKVAGHADPTGLAVLRVARGSPPAAPAAPSSLWSLHGSNDDQPYLDLTGDDLDRAIAIGRLPSCAQDKVDGARDLDSLERAVVALARTEPLSRLRAASRSQKLVAHLFGSALSTGLADRKLDVLRRYTIAIARNDVAESQRLKADMRRSGFSEMQIALAAEMAQHQGFEGSTRLAVGMTAIAILGVFSWAILLLWMVA